MPTFQAHKLTIILPFLIPDKPILCRCSLHRRNFQHSPFFLQTLQTSVHRCPSDPDLFSTKDLHKTGQSYKTYLHIPADTPGSASAAWYANELFGKENFGRVKKENKIGAKLARPISLFLTIVFAVGVIVLVMFGVIPQLTRTMGTLMMSIADFIPQMQSWIREFSHNNQEIMKLVDQVQFNPDQAIKWGISLLGNGAGNMMNTTMSAVGSIVSGLATFFYCFFICLLCSFSEG